MEHGTSLRLPDHALTHGAVELERASRLVHLAHELARSAGVGAAAETVAVQALELLAAGFVAVYALTPNGRLSLAGEAEVPGRARVRRPPAVVRRAAEAAGPARADAAELAELHARRLPCQAALALPASTPEALAGVLLVGSRSGGALQLDRDVARTVCDLAASALANARRLEASRAEARRDALTGLPNRRAFEEDLAAALVVAAEADAPVSLVLFDLDHFKQINDRYGHPRGDRVLRQVARVGLRTVRAAEEIYRVGGEEFAVLVPGDANAARIVAERVRAAVADERRLPLPTVSAGHATFPTDASSPVELVAHADAALYVAKRAGRNRVVCYSGEFDGVAKSPNPSSHAAIAQEKTGMVIRRIVLSELEQATDAIATLAALPLPTTLLVGACRELERLLGGGGAVVSRLTGDQVVAAVSTLSGASSQSPRRALALRDFPLVRDALEARRACSASIVDPDCDPAQAFLLDELGLGSVVLAPLVLDGATWGLVEVYTAEQRAFSADELRTAELAIEQVAVAVARLEHGEELRRHYRTSLAALAAALGGRRAVDVERCQELAELAVRVGLRLGHDVGTLRATELTGLLAPLVRSAAPVDLVLGDRRLSDEDRTALAAAAESTHELLAGVPGLDEVATAVRACSERWDGTGYPDGLVGDAIPVPARVVGACAAYLALLERRTYRIARSDDDARRELSLAAGRQFDPQCVAALEIELFERDRERAAPGLIRPPGVSAPR